MLPALRNLLDLLARMTPCDVQEVEGMNNLIKASVRTSPHISLPLLSARVVSAKEVGVKAGQKVKWSIVKPHFDSVLNEAVHSAHFASEVLNRPGRFHAVEPMLQPQESHRYSGKEKYVINVGSMPELGMASESQSA